MVVVAACPGRRVIARHRHAVGAVEVRLHVREVLASADTRATHVLVALVGRMEVALLLELHPLAAMLAANLRDGLEVVGVGDGLELGDEGVAARLSPQVGRLVRAAVRQNVVAERLERHVRRPRQRPPGVEGLVGLADEIRGREALHVRQGPLAFGVQALVLGLQLVQRGQGVVEVVVVQRVEGHLGSVGVVHARLDVPVRAHVGHEKLGRLGLLRVTGRGVVIEKRAELARVVAGRLERRGDLRRVVGFHDAAHRDDGRLDDNPLGLCLRRTTDHERQQDQTRRPNAEKESFHVYVEPFRILRGSRKSVYLAAAFRSNAGVVMVGATSRERSRTCGDWRWH